MNSAPFGMKRLTRSPRDTPIAVSERGDDVAAEPPDVLQLKLVGRAPSGSSSPLMTITSLTCLTIVW